MSARPRLVCALACAVIAVGLVRAAPARAQTVERADLSAQRPLRPPVRRHRARLGARLFIGYDLNVLKATQTFDAVLGTSQLKTVSGGGDLLNVWQRVFVRVEGSSLKKTGSRVVVTDKTATSLGIPVTVQMTPVVIGAGWRQPLDRADRVTVYGGGGFVHLMYRESSTFATASDDTDTTFNGYMAMGGIDLRVLHVVTVGFEGQVRSLPKAIGTAGASAAFGETDLGAAVARVLVGVRF